MELDHVSVLPGRRGNCCVCPVLWGNSITLQIPYTRGRKAEYKSAHTRELLTNFWSLLEKNRSIKVIYQEIKGCQ